MNILQNGIIEITQINEDSFEKLKNYVTGNKIQNFNMRLNNVIKPYFSQNDIKLLNEYTDILQKVKSINLYFSNLDLRFLKFIPNVSHITLPYKYNISESINDLKSMKNLKSISASTFNLVEKDLGLNVESLKLGSNFAPSKFFINNDSELLYLDYEKFKNCQNVKDFTLTYQNQVYSFTLAKMPKNLEKLTLIGNLNLKKINLSNNLENLKELKIYSNNPMCEFDAYEVVNIIKNKYENKYNLQKFVFDLRLYPEVVSILKDDLKDEKFKIVFENFAYVGEEVDGAFYEASISKMQKFDKMMEKIISRSGIQKDDNIYDAFAKLYLFTLENVSYHKAFVGNSNAEKFYELKSKIVGGENDFNGLKIMGVGSKFSTTMEGFTNDYNLICGGICRFLSYLLLKVGILSFPVPAFLSDLEEVLENRLVPPKYKAVNHMILKVYFNGKCIFVDPTCDLNNEVSLEGLTNLSFFSKHFLYSVDNFMECKYFIPKSEELNDEEKIRLFKAFATQIRYKSYEDVILKENVNKDVIKPFLSDTYRTQFNHYIGNKIIKNYPNYKEITSKNEIKDYEKNM